MNPINLNNINNQNHLMDFIKLLRETIMKRHMNHITFLILKNRTVRLERKYQRGEISQIMHHSPNVLIQGGETNIKETNRR